ncbi:hypothetical protein HYH03_015007 [Edaphochlamys debaryana]|uniref:Uncharacterized protein n=1 Tax=Edaphochlamys debaryana TaxID=47281 RepID=A0A835XLK8_9CHLO|nr:hypothetical protein HYH03_015007 [Edaphochlamys debaryana]|eukprot:KAG2486303.1 hypothetical protein HYH03_015007 [Edaphochlamys debaryana]
MPPRGAGSDPSPAAPPALCAWVLSDNHFVPADAAKASGGHASRGSSGPPPTAAAPRSAPTLAARWRSFKDSSKASGAGAALLGLAGLGRARSGGLRSGPTSCSSFGGSDADPGCEAPSTRCSAAGGWEATWGQAPGPACPPWGQGYAEDASVRGALPVSVGAHAEAAEGRSGATSLVAGTGRGVGSPASTLLPDTPAITSPERSPSRGRPYRPSRDSSAGGRGGDGLDVSCGGGRGSMRYRDASGGGGGPGSEPGVPVPPPRTQGSFPQAAARRSDGPQCRPDTAAATPGAHAASGQQPNVDALRAGEGPSQALPGPAITPPPLAQGLGSRWLGAGGGGGDAAAALLMHLVAAGHERASRHGSGTEASGAPDARAIATAPTSALLLVLGVRMLDAALARPATAAVVAAVAGVLAWWLAAAAAMLAAARTAVRAARLAAAAAAGMVVAVMRLAMLDVGLVQSRRTAETWKAL